MSHDMQFGEWPHREYKADQLFVIEGQLRNGRLKLIAPHFGGRPYGNGPVYISPEDAMPAELPPMA